MQLIGGAERGLRPHAELAQGGTGTLQARADHLDPAVGQLAQNAELVAAADQLRIDLLGTPAGGKLRRLDDFRRLVLERGAQGAGEVDDLAGAAVGGLEHAADRLQVQSLRLHFARHLDPRDVILVVVTGAAVNLGRRQQAAGLVGADVAHGHTGAPRQLTDRHLSVVRLPRFHTRHYIVSANR